MESGDSRERTDFFKKLNSEKSIAVVLMSLTGTVEHTKTHVAGHLENFAKYSWLWTQVKLRIYFLASFEAILLRRFSLVINFCATCQSLEASIIKYTRVFVYRVSY